MSIYSSDKKLNFDKAILFTTWNFYMINVSYKFSIVANRLSTNLLWNKFIIYIHYWCMSNYFLRFNFLFCLKLAIIVLLIVHIVQPKCNLLIYFADFNI